MQKEYAQKREWEPKTILWVIAKDVKYKWFKHITNNVASKHWATTSEPLPPSMYLDVALDDNVQPSIFNPTMSDVMVLTKEANAFRNGAMKKRTRRMMDIIDGNENSYSKWLNTPERVYKFAFHNSLHTLIGSIRSKKEGEKRNK